jgi:hypothetical protein
MGSVSSWPNFNGYINLLFGSADQSFFYGPPNVGLVFGTNPPYYLDDFLAVNPKFFGPPTLIANASTVADSAVVTVPSVAGLMPGQFVQVPNVPPGTVISSIGNGQITLSQQATATASNVSFVVYTAPPIPVTVILLYLNLANASLIQARWQEYWIAAMALFIAHYCTLYAQSDASEVITNLQAAVHTETPAGTIPGTVYTLSSIPPAGVLQALFKNGLFLTPGVDYTLSGQTITLTAPTVSGDVLQATWPLQSATQTQGAPSTAQIAAQGLGNGIMVSKSVGDVSASYQVLVTQESWGSLQLTRYGQMLIDMAKVIGSGPMLFT